MSIVSVCRALDPAETGFIDDMSDDADAEARCWALEMLREPGVFVRETWRVIEGIVTTPHRNANGDCIMPDGGEFTLPAVPLLVSHDFSRPIGHVIAAKASPSALWFRARVANWGPFRGLHEEWLRLQDGTYAAVSPGVRSLGGGVGTAREFTRWQWNELSVARVGANPHALINLVHELDRPHVVHLPGRGETIYRDLRPKVTTPQYRPAVAIGG